MRKFLDIATDVLDMAADVLDELTGVKRPCNYQSSVETSSSAPERKTLADRRPMIDVGPIIIQNIGPDGRVWPTFSIELEPYNLHSEIDSPDSESYLSFLEGRRHLKRKINRLLEEYARETGIDLPDPNSTLLDKTELESRHEQGILYYDRMLTETRDSDPNRHISFLHSRELVEGDLERMKMERYSKAQEPELVHIAFPPEGKPPLEETLQQIRSLEGVKRLISE